MKPIHVFIFGFCIIFILASASLIFNNHPPELFGYTFNVPLFSINNKTKYKDISQIIKLSKIISDTANSKKTDILKSNQKNSSAINRIIYNKTISTINTDSIKYSIREIEYPEGQDTLLFSFFRQLSNLKEDNKLIRILHYGDSQIEGDRITSYLRNQLQIQFGGNGTGLFPLIATNPSSMSYVYQTSDNWMKYSPFQSTSPELHFNKYGALISFAKMNESSGIKEMEGWIKLQHTNLPYSLTGNFQVCRIFYGFNKSPMIIELDQKKQLLDAELYEASSCLKVAQWIVHWPVNDLTVLIRTNDSPCIFGIALDGINGIAVDNIPLRGSSGLEFTKMDMPFLHDFYKLLNVKLLLLQFGVNIVPFVTDNYDYYKRDFIQQLRLLKLYNPDISIIVIGVSDVSRIGKNGYESYPNIEKIRDAQKSAAFETGCAFWDSFEAMGGNNSMPSWVFANPPLAQKDFIHFNATGAKIIGEMFYRSFMKEYKGYTKAITP
jgi:hypothetical protein